LSRHPDDRVDSLRLRIPRRDPRLDEGVNLTLDPSQAAVISLPYIDRLRESSANHLRPFVNGRTRDTGLLRDSLHPDKSRLLLHCQTSRCDLLTPLLLPALFPLPRGETTDKKQCREIRHRSCIFPGFRCNLSLEVRRNLRGHVFELV